MELVNLSKSAASLFLLLTENILTNATIYLLISHGPIFFLPTVILFFQLHS